MSLALYRKYRPQTFAQVIGQEHVTEPLSIALRSGRLHHAYLFSGPRGCGKTSSARILARSLNCAQGPTPEPCAVCDSCVSLALDGPGSIDVIEIDAASHGGVDDARDLRERAFFAPVASRFKIYVIDEAHMVSTQGFNALLKLVEEPPEYVKFVFATTEPEKVLATIKSRTHHYPFRLVPPAQLRPYLEQLCAAEAVAVEPAVYGLVIRAGGGSVRDTLSVLDQLIAGAGPDGVTYARAVALLGVTDGALVNDAIDALAAGDGAAVFATVERVSSAGHDPRRFAADLLGRLRDLIVLQQIPDAASKGLLDGPEDELARMTTQAQQFGPATLSRCADLLHDGLTEMRGTTGPRLLLELICARMLLPGADESVPALLQRMERMERRITLGDQSTPTVSAIAAPPTTASAAGGPAVSPTPTPTRAATTPSRAATTPVPVAKPAETTAEEPVTAPAMVTSVPAAEPATLAASLPAGALDAAAVRRVWDEVLTLVRRRSQRVGAVAREAVVRDVRGNTLVLVFKHQVHATMLNDHGAVLTESLHEVLGGDWKVECELGGEAGAARPAPQPPAPAAARPTDEPAPKPAAGNGSAPRGRPAAEPAGGSSGRRAPEDREGRAAGSGAVAVQSDGDDGWPEIARLGGVATAPEPVETAPAAAPAPRGASPTERATANAAKASKGGGRGGARNRPTVVVDGPPDDPPFDPDYDRPARPGFDGFDPGDEPLDDEDGGAPRQSSEQQALALLKETLGAEKIGETGR